MFISTRAGRNSRVGIGGPFGLLIALFAGILALNWWMLKLSVLSLYFIFIWPAIALYRHLERQRRISP